MSLWALNLFVFMKNEDTGALQDKATSSVTYLANLIIATSMVSQGNIAILGG